MSKTSRNTQLSYFYKLSVKITFVLEIKTAKTQYQSLYRFPVVVVEYSTKDYTLFQHRFSSYLSWFYERAGIALILVNCGTLAKSTKLIHYQVLRYLLREQWRHRVGVTLGGNWQCHPIFSWEFPPLNSETSTCAALRGHLSNIWALVLLRNWKFSWGNF